MSRFASEHLCPLLLLSFLAGPAVAQMPPGPPAPPPSGPRVRSPLLASEVFAPALQRRLANATVRVINGKGGFGAGTVVAREGEFALILTAWHILEDGGPYSVEVFFYDDGFGRIQEGAQLVAKDGSTDLALLRLRNDRLTELIPVCPPGVDPFARPRFAVLTSGCHEGTPSFRTAVVLENTTISSVSGNCWEIDHDPQKGRSGGALIDERGYLLGVCARGFDGKGYYSDQTSIRSLFVAAGRPVPSGAGTHYVLLGRDVIEIVVRLFLLWLVSSLLERWLGRPRAGERNGIPLLFLPMPFLFALLQRDLLAGLALGTAVLALTVLTSLLLALFAWVCWMCERPWSDPIAWLPALGAPFALALGPSPVTAAVVGIAYYVPLAARSWIEKED